MENNEYLKLNKVQEYNLKHDKPMSMQPLKIINKHSNLQNVGIADKQPNGDLILRPTPLRIPKQFLKATTSETILAN